MKPENKQNITIIGDGGWGTALAILLDNKGYEVTVWGAFPEYIENIKHTRINSKFLPNVSLSESIIFTSDLTDALHSPHIVVLASPSQYMASVLEKIKPLVNIDTTIFVNVSKGLDTNTHETVGDTVKRILGAVHYATLSGPCIAGEVAHNIPTAVTVAALDPATALTIQNIFSTPTFRVYTSTDVKGVELGGSLKNIIAIACGISDGLEYGVNTKSALLTRGLAEIVTLGTALGAVRETFYGLSGVGDLVTTCMSPRSRNRWFGEEIGSGRNVEDVLKETEMVVEGVATARAAADLAVTLGIEVPIISGVFAVVAHNKKPQELVPEIMRRPLRSE
ncbi:MAG: NAD(P)H-dependent glycerol-3-phosphate dehydrogenase [Candidatus Paceibacterota bacterium]